MLEGNSHSRRDKNANAVTAKAVEFAIAKAKLLRMKASDDIDSNYWRLSEMSELCNIGTESAMNASLIEFATDSLTFLSHEAALRGLHRYMGCFPTLNEVMRWVLVLSQDLSSQRQGWMRL